MFVTILAKAGTYSRASFTTAEHATAILYAANEISSLHEPLVLASIALLICLVLWAIFRAGERVARHHLAKKGS